MTSLPAYLLTLAGPESAGTHPVYRGVLRALAAEFGGDGGVATLEARWLAAWFTSRWGQRSPSTWNVALDALRSACGYWDVPKDGSPAIRSGCCAAGSGPPTAAAPCPALK
jgi:hypothetical protein